MAERGAVPQVSTARRRALGFVRSFTSPLLPDDYLELINPLWSTRELRGRVERVERETSAAVTVLIKPGWEWPGHQPGQYLRLGIEVDGVHHWRAYSLTSDPQRADGCIAITPKLVESGKVSPFLFSRVKPGAIVRLGGVEGTFLLPDPLPPRLLFISAGSGITPIMSMIRGLAGRGELRDVLHIHSARSAEGVIFSRELQELAANEPGYHLHLQITGERGRLTAEQLHEVCGDWGEREAFLCGPAGLLESMRERWRREGLQERLHMEHFQPPAEVGEGERGAGGAITFCKSHLETLSNGEQPILVAGEEAGVKMPYGCRMGICHSCVGRLRSGQVRDLRTGQVHGAPGELLRTCINAPEGPVEIDL
jgi:stearoyl-CoA 9-desaturase NADPH oxidoreductase